MSAVPSCAKCSAPLPAEYLNAAELRPCLGCGSEIKVEVFPALFRPPAENRAAEAVILPSEASCFYHQAKRASVICASCGRYLCALCDMELEGLHLCPGCLDASRAPGKATPLDQNRVIHDGIALLLAVLPLLFVFITVITAPLALYWAIRHWNSPSSLIPRTKWRLVAAIILSSMQIVAWLGILGYALTN